MLPGREIEEVSESGAARSVQEAEVLLPRPQLERLWRAESLEWLARSYWGFLARIFFGLIRVIHVSDSPTIVLLWRHFPLLHDELFGPIVTAYVYPDAEYAEMLHTIDRTSKYGLTGSVFARDRAAISEAEGVLRHAAGNFYINDKPTGAVVGQQPFGGSRASGTNDKAGSMLNLVRWTSPRTIKENFAPPTRVPYPFMQG